MRTLIPLRSLLLTLLCMLGIACEPTLQTLAIKAESGSAAKGTKVQLVATATYSDGSTQDVTSSVAWSTASINLATFSTNAGQKGLVQTLATGQVLLSATYKELSAVTTLTITAATLTRIDVSPPFAALAKGTKQPFSAVGTFTDGTSQDLTATATWGTADGAVAQITTLGAQQVEISAAARGNTTITAEALGQRGTATMTVTDAALTRLEIAPSTASAARGTGVRFSATGTFSDGTTQDLSSSVRWTSSDTGIAEFPGGANAIGEVSAKAKGTATLSAAVAGQSATATLTVTDASVSAISVTPPAPSLAKGTTTRLSATGTFSDGTIQDVTRSVSWQSSLVSVATVVNMGNNMGAVDALSQGAAVISASLGGKTGTATLNVTDAALVSIAVSADSASLAKGVAAQLVATGTFSDATTQDLTSLVVWSSTDSNIAAVSNTAGQRGRVTAMAKGMAALRAARGEISGSLAMTVSDATLASLTLSASSAQIAKGTSAQFSASGRFSDGSVVDLTSQVTWSCSDNAIASVSNAAGTRGQVQGLAMGSVTITAQSGAISATATFTVSGATLSSIAVSAASANLILVVGDTRPFVATGTYSDASVQDITSLVTWSVNSAGISLSNANGSRGVATPLAAGSALITATLGGHSGSLSVTVRSLGFGGTATVGLGLPSSAMIVTDLNGDKKPDVVTLDTGASLLRVMLGNGNGSFQAPTITALPFVATALVAGDMNGDNAMDVVVSSSSNGIAVIRGSGTGTFNGWNAYFTGVGYGSLATGDFNGDGKIDVVASGASSDAFFFAGDGMNSLAAGVSLSIPSQGARARAIDLNQDGKLDVVMASPGAAAVKLLMGRGDGTFQVETASSGNTGTSTVIPVDMNGDGRIDLVMNGNGNGPGVALRNADGSYGPVDYSHIVAQNIAVADMNGDGAPDVVLLDGVTGVGVLQTRAAGGFAPLYSSFDIRPSLGALVDLDSDGRPDVCGINGNQLQALMNATQ